MPTLLLKGKAIGQIKGVLFDKDGTLSNSENHLFTIANLRIQEACRVLSQQGATQDTLKQLQQLLSQSYGITTSGLRPDGTIAIGSRSNNLISTATILCLLGHNWPNAYQLANEIFHYVDLLDGGLVNSSEQRKLLPGVQQVLCALRKADVICAVISNDSRAGIQNFLTKNNLENLFTNFWSAENQPPKPDPYAVEGLCKQIKLAPSECALIGDADSDLLMARQSGIGLSLGYTGGWSQIPHLTQHHYLIKSWDELTIRQVKP